MRNIFFLFLQIPLVLCNTVNIKIKQKSNSLISVDYILEGFNYTNTTVFAKLFDNKGTLIFSDNVLPSFDLPLLEGKWNLDINGYHNIKESANLESNAYNKKITFTLILSSILLFL